MSIELLQQELAVLKGDQRRGLQAFLVALEDRGAVTYRRKLTEKIDAKVEGFATLEELDKRIKAAPDDKL